MTHRLRFWLVAAAAGILPLLLLGFLARPSAASGLWYVAPGGNDANDCQTTSTPCQTINTAIAKAGTGDTINVATGIYTGSSGSQVVWITQSVTLLGGWDSGFSIQTGLSTVDGQGVRQGMLISSTATAAIARFVVRNGYALFDAGGIDNKGVAALTQSQIVHNANGIPTEGSDGAGVLNFGVMTLTESLVTDNASNYAGGGLENSGQLFIISSTIANNKSATSSGGLENLGGYVLLTDTTVTGNWAATTGGIDNSASGTLRLYRSTVSGNASNGGAGGISNNGTLVIDDSTISNNASRFGSCGQCGGGGGIVNNSGAVSIHNTTISGNSGLYGGGINNQTPVSITLKNSIVAGNKAYVVGPDCLGAVMSQGYDLIGDVGGCTFSSSTGDLTNIDPKLGKLIGWPGYQPLLAGSPAINAGNPGGCVGSAGPLATDERGAGRVGRCDIGAYEYTAAGPASQIVAYAGTPQSAAPTAAFRTPFQALVLDSSGSPVSNASVLFTAPQNGASGVFTGTSWLTATAATNDSGIAVSPAFTANSTPGAYVISATVSGIITPALLAVTNIAWYVTPTGTDLNSCQTPATPCGTIGGAVEKAGAGDTVEVAVGIYTTSSGAQVVLIDRDLFLLGGWNKLFTLQGGMSTMDGSGVRQVMVVQGGVAAQAEDFIIQHGLPSSTQAAGLINYGVLDLTNAVISKNPPGEGIANFGVLNVSQSLISDNTSGVVNWGLLALNDSTISGNPGSGVANGGIAWLSNDTISGNAVVGGSGFFDLGNGARATLQNTIVAGNAPTTTGDCWGTFVSGGYNLIGDHTQNCTFAAAAGDQLNQQPLLGPLQDNGGRNLSQAPLAGSPAINAGNPAGCVNNLGSPIAVDQRGYPRFGRCDIGAVEIQPLDLSEKTVDHDTQLPGQAVRYTVRLKNGGGSSLPGVAVTDTLPAGLKYITGTLAASGGSAGYVSGVITWTGTVEAGATTTIQFSAASLPNASLGTVLTNTAVIRGGGEEFTRQASLTLGLAKIYLPLNFKPLPGIQGYVTVNGVPTGGVFLELRRFDGNAYSTQLSLYTDSNGYYNFSSAPSLPPGQFYYVRYLNTNNTLGWLSYWATAQISSYAAGSALGMGSFDLADILLAAPDPGVTVSLPTSFQWVRRPATPTDSYQLSLFDPQGSAFDQSTLLGYVSGVTVTGLSNSFSAGRPYGWYVAVNSPDGGYGESFYYRRITFNNTNTAAENRADVVSGAALSAATRPVDRPPR